MYRTKKRELSKDTTAVLVVVVEVVVRRSGFWSIVSTRISRIRTASRSGSSIRKPPELGASSITLRIVRMCSDRGYLPLIVPQGLNLQGLYQLPDCSL